MTDNLGQSQVLPYLNGLSKKGCEIHLISFEKFDNTSERYKSVEKLISSSNINWHPLGYHAKPPVISTLFDVRNMIKKAKQLHQTHGFDLVHCRSYISALAGLELKKTKKVPFIFDIRGFWADERVDGKIWNLKNPIFNLIYRYFKQKEKEFLAQANQVISLTNEAENEIHSWPGFEKIPIEVIPCCADLSHFSPLSIDLSTQNEWRRKLKLENEMLLCYLGSVGTWYLLDEMLLLFKKVQALNSQAHFLFISSDDPKIIKSAAKNLGIDEQYILVKESNRKDLPSLLSLCDASIFFIKKAYSKKASSPTKMGELMGMNIPIICNSGVGDVASIIQESGGGIIIHDFEDSTLEKGAKNLLNELKIKKEHYKIEVVKHYFDLDIGIEKYWKCYQRITQS